MNGRTAKRDTELSDAELGKVTGGTEIKTGQAPSTSSGQTSSSTSRQTADNSFATKIVGGAG
jgi:hypothetical protein